MAPGGAIEKLTSRPLVVVVLGLYWLLTVALIVDYYRRLPQTGDFIAFYTGGAAVARGQGERLYDEALQVEIQRELGSKGLYPYVYPASFAVALSPLAKLPYKTAFIASNALNFLAGVGAVVLLALALPRIRERDALTAFLAVFGFQPLLRVWLAGGQTTILTLALIAGATFAFVREKPLLVGLFLGLLGYKPQFLPPFLLLLLVRRAWLALAVTAGFGVLHWAVGALACGPRWPLALMDAAKSYQEAERAANYATHISWLSVLDRLLPGPAGRALAIVLVTATLGGLVVVALRGRDKRYAWAYAGAAALLVSPHTQYYDVGILVVPVLLGLEVELERGRPLSTALRGALVAGFFGYEVYTLSEKWGFQPLILWPVVAALWLATRALEDAPEPTP